MTILTREVGGLVRFYGQKVLGIVGEGVRGEVSSWIKVVPNGHGLNFEPEITESFDFPPLRRVFLGPKAKTFSSAVNT